MERHCYSLAEAYEICQALESINYALAYTLIKHRASESNSDWWTVSAPGVTLDTEAGRESTDELNGDTCPF